jgi:hypothetical protein
MHEMLDLHGPRGLETVKTSKIVWISGLEAGDARRHIAQCDSELD